MKPRLVVNLIGGLGNQLFQYACGWSLAQSSGRQLVLDAGGFEQYRLRPFLLDRLAIRAPRASDEDLRGWGLQAGRWARIRRRFLGTRIAAVREQGLPWQALALPAGQDVWINGYWQTERYFASQAPSLRQQFKVRAQADAANARLLRQIKQAGAKAAAVHVRRGDYVSSPMAAYVHGSVGLAYYAEALRRLRAKVKGAKLFVFSDEPAWARAKMPFLGRATFVSANPPEAPEQDLRLMSACRHFVLANSSFSWWGAWLGEGAGSQILAPPRWFHDKSKDARDLVPERWQRVHLS
jgi:hypothetical protein